MKKPQVSQPVVENKPKNRPISAPQLQNKPVAKNPTAQTLKSLPTTRNPSNVVNMKPKVTGLNMGQEPKDNKIKKIENF